MTEKNLISVVPQTTIESWKMGRQAEEFLMRAEVWFLRRKQEKQWAERNINETVL